MKTKCSIQHANKYLELFENVRGPVMGRTFEERIMAIKNNK